MIALAFEMSTRQGSLALFSGGKLLGMKTWNDEGARSQTLFELLPQVLGEAGLRLEQVEAFVVGRGPGSYTGLRVALTAARSLALPKDLQVYTLNSGLAFAAEIFAGSSARQAAVIGDARRERLWIGVFQREGLAQSLDWTLIPIAELPRHLAEGTTVVSPDWARLVSVLPVGQVDGVTWEQADRCPTADWLGRVGLERWAQGVASEPLTPIYMHPPVFLPPQYPVRDP
ncbi:MAG TPA: tRNA (adenosine(37)-N6)-threonylcarbamoyltransferase complex dimerization subunit type 1 TsaB [Verrucomicrobia bacterium]|nr:MAG: tRNA (adenosine(37)-N6)-threonylcarbamoyltransferase complex dimerization subunit type 1 TsaB [Lentisphaerae bacterium GWF2_57_35]HBA85753.1 tRNA (adenosine(37)-N6)-threonylcarbamoyltransferase complex dimerization subunit type 1 TsaB [Verrucomicrobiota bacterium]